jgi:hypothetical protein
LLSKGKNTGVPSQPIVALAAPAALELQLPAKKREPPGERQRYCVVFNSERDAAQESLFNAEPGLSVNRASNWSPEAMRYDAELFKKALPELLKSAPRLQNISYDLVDLARQTLGGRRRRGNLLAKAV